MKYRILGLTTATVISTIPPNTISIEWRTWSTLLVVNYRTRWGRRDSACSVSQVVRTLDRSKEEALKRGPEAFVLYFNKCFWISNYSSGNMQRIGYEIIRAVDWRVPPPPLPQEYICVLMHGTKTESWYPEWGVSIIDTWNCGRGLELVMFMRAQKKRRAVEASDVKWLV